jgi:hypothetical protein
LYMNQSLHTNSIFISNWYERKNNTMTIPIECNSLTEFAFCGAYERLA